MNTSAIIFPGQASQYIGMGKKWFDKYDLVKKRFDQASDVLGWDIAKLCFYGAGSDLVKTENAQAAIVTLSVAVYETAVSEFGVSPSYLAGHSIGEISALAAAGVFDFKDAVKIAKIRGEAMASCNKNNEGGMAAVVKMDVQEVETLLSANKAEQAKVFIANYNSPSQTIISGSLKGIDMIKEKVEESGGRVVLLNVSGPFHSEFMEPAQEKLKEALHEVKLGVFKVPVMCGHTGTVYDSAVDVRERLVEQMVAPVRWIEVVNELNSMGVNCWYEAGPKNVLKKLVEEILPDVSVEAYDDLELEVDQTAAEETGSANPIGLCLGAAVSTKNSNWDEEEYRTGVLEPYREMQQIYRKTETDMRRPTEAELGICLKLLQKIFITKGVLGQEMRLRYRKILKNTGYEEAFAGYTEGEDINDDVPVEK